MKKGKNKNRFKLKMEKIANEESVKKIKKEIDCKYKNIDIKKKIE